MIKSVAKRFDPNFTAFSALTFFFSPLLSIPLIFAGFKNRSYGAFFLYALLLGTFAYVMLPYQDLYRHSLGYYSWAGVPFSSITFYDFTLNGIMTYIEWCMVNYNIPFEYLRVVNVIIAFLLLSKVFNYLLLHSNRNYTKQQIFSRLLIFLLFFDFFYTAEGVRFGVALSFYIYSVHELIDLNSKFKCIIFVIFAACIHLSFIFLAPLSFLIYNLKLKKSQAFILIVALFFIFGVLISQFAYILGPRAEWYFSNNEDGVSSYGAMTGFGLIGYFLPKLASIPFIIILFRYYDVKNKWNRIALSWLIISMVTITNPVIFYRTIWVFMAMGIYLLISIEKRIIIKNKLIRYIIIGGFVFVAVNTARYAYSMTRSPLISKIIIPVPFLYSTHPYFDLDWLDRNVKPDGSPN